MYKVQELIDALGLDNKLLLGFVLRDNRWLMYALDLKLSGKYPVLEESRDNLDFRYKVKAWEKAGRFVFSVGKSFDEMIDAAVAQLGK